MKALRSIFIFLLISITSMAQAYTVFEENGKAGLKDSSGKVLIPARYDAIGWSNGQFSVVNNVTGYLINNKWGLISLGNQKITKELYAELLPSEGNYFVARKKPAHSPRLATGCIDQTGKEIIPFQYDGIRMSGLRAIVYTQIGNQYRHGLIDLSNKTLIPQQFQEIKSVGTLRYAVRNFEGKTALFADNGRQITEFTIDSLSDFHKNFAILYQGQLKGLVDRDGIFKLPVKFRDMRIEASGKVSAREVDEWFFFNGNNTAIQQVRADSVITAGVHLLKIRTSDEVQLTNEKLNPIVKTKFTDVGSFSKGRAIYKLGSLKGLLSKDGTVIVPALYHDVIPSGDFILTNLKQGGRDNWLLFDSLGNRKISKTYESILPLQDRFAVRSRGYWGVIDQSGKEIIACAYDSLLQAKDDHVVVKFKGLYGVIDVKETWKVTPRNNKLMLINNDRLIEYAPTSAQLKSMNGNVIYFTNNRFEIHEDHLLEYLANGNVWRIDLNGVISSRQAAPTEPTERIYEESEGYRAIKRNGRYGFIDSRGRLRIANRYENVQAFSDSYAAVKILGKWGFVNQQDNIAVQPVYEEVWPFKKGFAHVKQKGLFGLIDKKGKQVLPVRYEKIEILMTGNLLIQQNGLQGLADNTGKILIQPRYSTLQDVGDQFSIVSRDGKYGVVSEKGLSTVPMIYDYIYFDTLHRVFVGMKKSSWIEMQL